MTDLATAEALFIACETGKGWAGCAEYCYPDAGFSAQADALADVTTLAAYAEWMKGLLVPVPDGAYTLTGFAHDAARDTVIASAVFTGTHSADGGPMPPTGKAAQSEYVYVIKMDAGRVRRMTKVWNDAWALRQFGWA